MKVGETIKQYRLKNDLSLREFANKCGLSHAYISRLEDGIDHRSGKEVEPTLDTVKRIADAINLPLDHFLKKIGYLENSSLAKAESSKIFTQDKELLDLWLEMENRQDLQLLLKKVKNLPPATIERIIRYIKMVEKEEANEVFDPK